MYCIKYAVDVLSVCQTFSFLKEATSFIQSDCHRSWKLFKTFKQYWRKPFQFFKTRNVLYTTKCCNRVSCKPARISRILNYSKLFIWFDLDRSIVEDSVRKQICMKPRSLLNWTRLMQFWVQKFSNASSATLHRTLNFLFLYYKFRSAVPSFYHTKVTLHNHEFISLHFIMHKFQTYKVQLSLSIQSFIIYQVLHKAF